MKLHHRSDCAALQVRIPILNTDGKRSGLVRSLRTTDTAEAAARADSLSALASGIHQSDWLTVQRLVEDVFKASGVPLPAISQHPLPELVRLQDFAEAHLKRRAGKVSGSHLDLCRRALTSFWRAHKGMGLREVEGHHVQAWADRRMESAAVGTVRNELAAVNGLFVRAVALGHVRVNPCAGVDLARYVGVVERLPFPDADFERLLAFLKTENAEWHVLANLCRYSGLRLRDAARLECSAVRMEGDVMLLALTVAKTSRALVTPVFDPLASILGGFVGKHGPMCPALSKLSTDRLSKQFAVIMDRAGIDPMRVTLPNGRQHCRLSAHGLRHAYISSLARMGVPEHLRLKLAGHSTVASHRGYVHADGMELHRQLAPYLSAIPKSHD